MTSQPQSTLTTVRLDGRPFSPPGAPADVTLDQLLESAKSSLIGSGRLLVSLDCDGDTLTAERLEELMPEPISRFECLELHTEHPKGLVLAALEDTRRSFADTFSIIREASEALAAGDTAEAMKGLAESVGRWNQVQDAIVKGGVLLNVDFDSLTVADRSLSAWLGELLERLRDLKNAVESRDNVLLGDMLRYEFDEMLQGWEAMLAGFIRHVEQLPDDVGLPGAAAKSDPSA